MIIRGKWNPNMNGALNGHVIELNGTMLNGCFSITTCLITKGHGSSFQTMLLDLTATSLESCLVIRKSEVHIIYNIPFPILLGTPPISIKYMFFFHPKQLLVTMTVLSLYLWFNLLVVACVLYVSGLSLDRNDWPRCDWELATDMSDMKWWLHEANIIYNQLVPSDNLASPEENGHVC